MNKGATGSHSQSIYELTVPLPYCALFVDAMQEDEVHFLFQCPTYSMIRNKFYYEVKTLIKNITQLPINGLINELMNSSNYFIIIQFIKYISARFDVRDKLLSKYRNCPVL